MLGPLFAPPAPWAGIASRTVLAPPASCTVTSVSVQFTQPASPEPVEAKETLETAPPFTLSASGRSPLPPLA